MPTETEEEKRLRDREYYLKNREKKLAYLKKYNIENKDKIRQRCAAKYQKNLEVERSKRRAYEATHRKEAITRASNWVAANRERNQHNQKVYRSKNAAHLQAYKAEYHKRNRNKIRAYNIAYRIKHKSNLKARSDAYRQANRGVIKARNNARYEKYPEVYLANAAKRKAVKKRAAIGTDRKSYALFLRHIRTAEKIPCYWCKKPTSRNDRHKDHIIPLSRGGPDAVENLCCSCARCNLQKQSKLPEEFAGQFELRFCGAA